MADLGEGPGGPPAPLFLDQTEARRAEKNVFWGLRPPYLRDWMTPPPLPPYLKVWIRHCEVPSTRILAGHTDLQIRRIQKKPVWRPFSKSWGFGERIHYFRVIYAVSKTPGFVRT